MIGVGMPQLLVLNAWGSLVQDALGERPYLVGSAATSKQWRDVDVRVMLDDDDFAAMFGEPWASAAWSPKWCAFCMAFAAWGREFTGLPIDFQIQPMSHANERHDGPRIPLAFRSHPTFPFQPDYALDDASEGA